MRWGQASNRFNQVTRPSSRNDDLLLNFLVIERSLRCFTAPGASYTPPARQKPVREERHHRRKTKSLWALIVIAVLYSFIFVQRRVLTGNPTIDGALSVLLGLFICSRPAGNAIDLLFYERVGLRRIMSGWTGIAWLALNVLTLLLGWIVIYIGTAHLTGRGD